MDEKKEKSLKLFEKNCKEMMKDVNKVYEEYGNKYMMLLQNSPYKDDVEFRTKTIWSFWDPPFYIALNNLVEILNRVIPMKNPDKIADYLLSYPIKYGIFLALRDKLEVSHDEEGYDEYQDIYVNMLIKHVAKVMNCEDII